MKLALGLCVALLFVVSLQAEGEMSPPVFRGGTRITNGRPAAPREFPFMAHIVSTGGGTWNCAGSLITRDAVLTTAWCIYYFRTYTVRLGSIYRTSDDPEAWTITSRWGLTHPNYNTKTNDNNLGIIYLPERPPLSVYIQVVDLPRSPDVGSFLSCRGIVSGWGRSTADSDVSEHLNWAKVTVIPNEICKRYFPNDTISDRSLCAGRVTSTVYENDGGTPLVIYTKRRFMQIGIHNAYVSNSYNTSAPAHYARVTAYLDWINLKTKHQN